MATTVQFLLLVTLAVAVAGLEPDIDDVILERYVEDLEEASPPEESPDSKFLFSAIKCKESNSKDGLGKFLSWLVKDCSNKQFFNNKLGTMPIPLEPPNTAFIPEDLKPLRAVI